MSAAVDEYEVVDPRVAPVVRTLSSTFQRYAPFPPPPEVQVHVGVAVLMGVTPKTTGAVGAVRSMMIVVLADRDQLALPAFS